MATILDKNVWAQELLKTLGNASPSANTIKFVQAWEIHESGSGASIGCDNNPLNTCQETIGSTPCNPGSGCVQSYDDTKNQYVGQGGGYREGLNATAQALNNGLYPSLLHALRFNDENNLGFNGGLIAPNVASDLSVWGTGQRTPINYTYVNAIVQLAGQASLPSGGDLGQVGPGGNPVAAIDWNRVAKAGIGTIVLLAGVSLLIKTLSPSVRGFVK